MPRIYHHAVLTISADLSSDGSGGLFSTRSSEIAYHTEHLDEQIQGHAPRTQALTISVSLRQLLHPVRAFTADELPEIDKLPLMTRAWTFQERILSTRIVHFTKQEMVWECRKELNCECGICYTSPYCRFLSNGSLKQRLNESATSTRSRDPDGIAIGKHHRVASEK